MPALPRLVLDTATRRSIVAAGDGPLLVAASVLDTPHRHGSRLLEQLDAVLREAGIGPDDLVAVGVGTGPGSFTGLRVGLAAAKTIAWSLGIPIVGIATTDALRWATAPPGDSRAEEVAVLLPAGVHDHYLALPGVDPVLLPPGSDPAAALGGRAVIAVGVAEGRLAGCRGPSGRGPTAAGDAALDGLASALLAILDERLRTGPGDDVAALVPSYVALPRGIAPDTARAAWSPDLR